MVLRYAFISLALFLFACSGSESGSVGVDDGGGAVDTTVAPDRGDPEDVPPVADVPGDAGAEADLAAGPDVSVTPSCDEPPGGFGCPCAANGDCDSGFCVSWDEGYVCTDTCTTECPEGWVCRSSPQFLPDVVFLCIPGASTLCLPCGGDGDCGDGLCLSFEDGMRCTRPCDPELRPCPEGYTCGEAESLSGGEASLQCLPLTNACDCGPWTEEGNLVRACRNAGEAGTCWGEQTCTPDEGWSECSAAVPAAERCNGTDDDCNGLIDDVPGRGEACTVDNGVGSCPGLLDCPAEGTELVCNGPTPVAERCNGVDDDCDGLTDEAEDLTAPLCHLQDGLCAGATRRCGGTLGWVACDDFDYPAGFQRLETRCDGVDNDCDGATDDVDQDNDGHRPVACGGDDCADGNPLVYAGAAEICGDGLDNDCNGTPEDRDADEDGVVAAACGGPDCNDASELARPGLEEICGDGLDNDCDGSIDNRDADEDGFFDPACGGADCDDTRDSVHPGAEELCDGLDNDCNGATDDRDRDGDGFVDDDPVCGGADCDDGRDDVSPDGTEICGNEVDEDCSGLLDDRDLDEDGAISGDPSCGGTDCDDSEPRARPGLVESYDLLDNDCNGAVDEGLVPVGSVIVSEIMSAPQAVAAAAGQYVELTNVWYLPVNLAGWGLSVGGAGAEVFEGQGALIVAAQDVAVLCRETDPALNGGVLCDGRFPGPLFGASADTVVLLHGAREIDRVSYTGAAPFPAPLGQSLTLAPTSFSAEANDRGGNWCAAGDDDVLTGGDFGTPGLVNPPCSPAPTIEAITPDDGTDVGGFPVVITGSGFRGATDVRLGAASCVDWVVQSDTEIHGTTAPQLAGDVDVVVEKGLDEAVLAGGYRYTGVYTPLITWTSCGRRPTQPVSATAGAQSPDLYGEVRWSGVTGDEGSHEGILAELGYGPEGSHPRFTPGWQWFPAVYERPYFDNDEYRARLTIPAPGTYSYVFRFSEDGGYNWEYGDFEPGTADGFELDEMGRIVVN